MERFMNAFRHIFILACLSAPVIAGAQDGASDTLRLRLPQAESLFVAKSIVLIAKRFEIEEGKASEIQARLWDNPNLSMDQGFYNWKTRKYLDITPTGETAANLQQLIALAGKRSKRAELERLKGRITEYEFFDLLRGLKHELRNDFSDIHFLQAATDMYDQEIASVRSLIAPFREQYRKGNVSLTEISRLQAMLFELEDERRDMTGDMREKRAELNLMLLLPPATTIIPILDTSALEGYSAGTYTPQQLLDAAQEGRYDLKIKQVQVDADLVNLALQKAMRIPDVTLGAAFDRAGSYIDNYNSITLAFDIPLWNRNQGGIRIAENQVKASQLLAGQAPRQLESEVYQSRLNAQEMDSLYKSWKEPFARDFDSLADGIYRSYAKKAISLLEFVDFFQSYKESKNRLYRLQNGRINAFENINFTTGKDLFKF